MKAGYGGAIRGILLGVLFGSLAAIATPALAEEGQPTYPGSPQEVRPILIGAPVPAVELRTADDEAFDLKAELDGAPAVLIFYRGGW